MQLISTEDREKAFHSAKKLDVIRRQLLPVRYHVEDFAVHDRPRRFLEAFAAILKHTNYRVALDQYVRVSAKCSRCTVKCQVYLATGDEQDIPCYRSELLLSVYRRHFTVAGVLRARLLGNPGLTDDKVQEMAGAFYNCTACRRCHFECPMGIDHGLLTHLGRYILSEIGIIPRALAVSVREQLIGSSGNTSAVPVPALLDTLEFLSDEIKEGLGLDVKFPVDVQGAEYLFFPAVSDYIMEADTLMGNAAVFHATGDVWTIGTGYFDGINYGLFYSDQILEHVVKKVHAEAERLHVKKLLIGECGHASRTAKVFYPTYCGEKQARPVVSIMEYTHKAWRDGKLKLKPNVITERVTYHDPCYLGRYQRIFDPSRQIVGTLPQAQLREMENLREKSLCCGAGGGVREAYPEFSAWTAGERIEEAKVTGADAIVTACPGCEQNFIDAVAADGAKMKVFDVVELVAQAL